MGAITAHEAGDGLMSDRLHHRSQSVNHEDPSLQYYNMASYLQDSFAFAGQHPAQIYYPNVGYSPYMIHSQQQMDDYQYDMAEYAEFMAPAAMHDGYGETEEVSTRPRLTKEQVEVLEAEFQANHKPNSQVKRNLAIQTGLKFQRVGVRYSHLG